MMAAVIFIFHLKPLLTGASFHDPSAFHHDFFKGAPATLRAITDLYESGYPPLWISTQGMGSPYLGLYLPSVSHPLVLLFFRFSLHTSIALVMFANTMLAAAFGYLLFRRCGASPWASASTGVLLSLSGFLPWVTIIYPIAFPVPWMLCWLWSAIGLHQKPLFGRWVWNAVSVYLIIICGDAQIVVQGAYLLAGWHIVWAWRSRKSFSLLAKSYALLLCAAAAGWVLASVQMIPAMLLFVRTVTVRTPTLGEYASTYFPIGDVVPGALGLFTRLFRNLFLPLSVVLLLAAGIARKRDNPALRASLIVSVIIGVIVLGGRSGLAAIPFHLPMLKPFIRHYKWALMLEAPLFIGLALGFDALVEEMKNRNRRWIYASILLLAFTLAVLPDNFWRALLILAAGGVWLGVKSRSPGVPALLFLLLVLDVGSFAWQTPYHLEMPRPDPLYLKYVERLGPRGRVQGMFPWTHWIGHELKQPLPSHGHGYFGEYSIDLWLQFPIRNHAYLLTAMVPEKTKLVDGVFHGIDFSTPFKSTDFVTPRNRRLVNLVALKYFFLQDMALSEADRFPILSDPEYLVNPARPHAFSPWKRAAPSGCAPGSRSAGPASMRPALASEGYGVFSYLHLAERGDELETGAAWDRTDEPKTLTLVSLVVSGEKEPRLAFARALSGAEKGEAYIRTDVGWGQVLNLGFSAAPVTKDKNGAAKFEFFDPQIINRGKTIKYLEGKCVMVFDNTRAFPRARMVHRARIITENEKALGVMKSPGLYSPEQETILMDSRAPVYEGSFSSEGNRPALVSFSDSKVVVKVQNEEPGYLVLADTYYPGWKAFDEKGGELRIYRADMSLRAVVLGPGSHTVTFRYLPADFRVGLFASLAGWAAIIAAALGNAVRPGH